MVRTGRDGCRCSRKELQRFPLRTVALSREGMLTSGVSVAEVQQALTLVPAIVFILLGVSAFLTTRRKTRSCSGFLRGLLLFDKQFNGVLFNLAVATAIIVFVPIVGLLMYAALASTLPGSFFEDFEGVVLAHGRSSTCTVAVCPHVPRTSVAVHFGPLYSSSTGHMLSYAKAFGPSEDRGEAVEMASARSPGHKAGTWTVSLTFYAYAVCTVSFNPQRQTSGGHRSPEPDCRCDRYSSSKRVRLEERTATGVPLLAHRA